jgi:hypothetical protein
MNIIELLTKDESTNLNKLIKDYNNKINEFEVSFFSSKDTGSHFLTLDKFNQLNSVLSKITEKNEEKYQKKSGVSLDIIMHMKELQENAGSTINYRISITDINKINEYMGMLHMRKNHLVFGILVGFLNSNDEEENKDNSKYITLIKKIKNYSRYIKLEDIYMKIKMDNEEKVTPDELKKLQKINKYFDQNSYDIFYRLKERNSYFIVKDKNIFRIDLTNARTSLNINSIEKNPLNYEIELECEINDKTKVTEQLFSISEFIIKVIQQSNNIVTKSISNNVLDKYRDILGIDNKKTNLYGRQPISLEVQHVVDQLPNRYSVTDKADGDRYFMIILDEKCYLISTNLIIKDSGLVVNKKYNNSIIDGELVFLQKNNRYIYMAFDCLIYCNKNVREESNLLVRLEFADDIVNGINKGNYEHKYLKNNKKLDITNTQEILDYHKKNLYEFYEDIDKELKSKNNKMLVRRKYFIETNGVKDNEIFTYSNCLWKLFSSDTNLKCPYHLDGLIYQPQEQKYVVEQEKIKYFDYKWKPPAKNSLDFYIEFEKDKVTGKILTIYDNSVNDVIKNKPYQICNLFVGQNIKGIEKPILFNKEEGINQAYIYLDETGDIRSTDGKQLSDKTVVEFIYHMNDDINDKFRWIPLKTRFDKTEAVQKYQKRYGNYIDIANKVWRSINNPVLMEDFNELSIDNLYEKNIKKFRNKIDFTVIKKENALNVYYQKKSELIKDMRSFHNWIKSNIIYIYVNPVYHNKIQYKVFDIGCGRGGDIMKFYYALVELYIGIDPDSETLFDSADGALSRYMNIRKKYANFPQMQFITGSPTNLLQYDEQVKLFGRLNNDTKKIYEKYFTFDDKRILFDRFNCSFAIHYLLGDENNWDNFCKNVNMYLRDGGYFLFETFDGDKVRNLLKDKDKYSVFYDENGEKKLLFDIVKKYDENNKNKLGNAIDVHMAWISEEGVYQTEYLVYSDFIIKSLKEKCNLVLVETDTFENVFINNKSFLETGSQIEEDEKTKKFYSDVYKFYTPSEINKSSYEYSFLNRYYVFRKVEANLADAKTKYFTQQKGKIIPGKIADKQSAKK